MSERDPGRALAFYQQRIGQEVGVSSWIQVDQRRINEFASSTNDMQFIHVDPVRAATTAFGGPIAHGFLTLSLLSSMAFEVLPLIEGTQSWVNYGINSLRFLSPVKSGKNVRGRFTLKQLAMRAPGQWQFVVNVVVEIEDEAKAALVVDWVLLATA